jgi:predicted small metal-binding protein
MPDDKVVRCDCGHRVVIGDDEADLVEEIRSHARNVHGIAFSVEEALLIVFRSQLDLTRESLIVETRSSRLSPNEGGER